MVNRRNFLGIAAATIGAAGSARGQNRPARVAWLSPTKAADGSVFLDELRTGLRELGYAEPRSIVVQPYWGEDSVDMLSALVAEIVAAKPDVIVVQGSAALAVRRSSSSIPIVFGYSGDPIEADLVDSLARPGRNLTGISYLTLELVGKRLELLKEILPNVRTVAAIANPQHPGNLSEHDATKAAADRLGLGLAYFEAQSGMQQMEVLKAIEGSRVDAVMLFPIQSVIFNRARIAEWSMRTRIPTISGWAQFAEGGNLMSYGPNLRAASRRLAAFVERILKGARPAELPVELPSNVEFALNLKAAKLLAVDIPASILARADNVIE